MTGKRCYSLPELYDGGGEARVGGVGRHPVGFVLAVGVLDAVLGVPGLIALGPGQLGLKALHTQYKERVKTIRVAKLCWEKVASAFRGQWAAF